MSVEIIDSGTLAYRPAWDLQLRTHERVQAGELPDGAVIMVEHPPVITLGRRASAAEHLLVPRETLDQGGVELIESDRGGDITFHGPGQLVAYPVVPLNVYGLNLHQYMRWLEKVVIDTLASFDLNAHRVEGCTGVWTRLPGASPVAPQDLAKICALGVKLRRWITLHGLALNVTTDLTYFTLINPCGLSRPVTSMQAVLGDRCPHMQNVKARLGGTIRESLQSLAKK